MEDITDADYEHTKRVYNDFKIKNLREYYDLYVQSKTFLLADVFENSRNMCLKIYERTSSCKISFSSWVSMERSFDSIQVGGQKAPNLAPSPPQQKLPISGEKILMSAELKGCFT